MEGKIFYSWQSDLHNSTNRGFIQKALDNAVKTLKAEDTLSIEIALDRDTANVPGSPDIAQTVFTKIEQSQVFVCDISIINQGSEKRLTCNPSVLIELGYALHALGSSRIILVVNKAFGVPEQLPFDVRGRRVLDYCVATEQTEKALQLRELEKKLTNALKLILLSLNIPPTTPLEKLKVFKETNECKKLLANPHKLGYVSIFLPMIISFLLMILMSHIIVNSYNNLTSAPIMLSISSLPHVVFLIFYLCIFVISTLFFIRCLKMLFRGEFQIQGKHIECIPVWIISQPKSIFVTFDNGTKQVDIVTLVDSKGNRREVIQPRNSNRAILIKDDIGVVYLERVHKFGSLGETSIIVDFQRYVEK